jgi:hypothetical protein
VRNVEKHTGHLPVLTGLQVPGTRYIKREYR